MKVFTAGEKWQSLKEKLFRLQGDNNIVSNEELCQQIAKLQQELAEDSFSVVVLGQFSRGKSTFVNALLGENLIPMDVLPETATINTIRYGKNPSLRVAHNDGRLENLPLTTESLAKFSAQNAVMAEHDIAKLVIDYPADFLHNGVMLVDTPGTEDLGDQRAEITYSYIPHANAVIFLLDATAPLKKNEQEFIAKRLIPQGVDNIIFIANKYDNVDEEEDDVVDRLTKRLAKAFMNQDGTPMLPRIVLFPCSATMALKGKLTGNQQMVAESGIIEIQEALAGMLDEANIERLKEQRYEMLYGKLLSSAKNYLMNSLAICSADKNRLEEMSSALQVLRDEHIASRQELEKYVDKEIENIKAMTDKSLKYFYEHIQDDITGMVMDYNGADFKSFVEGRVVKNFQRDLEAWVGGYAGYIDQLIAKLEHSLTEGLCRRFNTKLNSRVQCGSVAFDYNTGVAVTVQDLSYTDVQAGAISAVGGIGLTLIAGGALMPFVSFAAMPLIRRKLLEQRLTAAKKEVVPLLQDSMVRSMVAFREELHSRITANCQAVAQNAVTNFEILLSGYNEKIQHQLDNLAQENSGINQLNCSLQSSLNLVNTL